MDYERAINEKSLEGMRRECESLVWDKIGDSKIWNLLKSVYYRMPYTVYTRCSKALRNQIHEIISSNHIDLIIVEFPYMLPLIASYANDIPVLLEQHNIEWRTVRSIADTYPAFSVRHWFNRIESYRLRKYEQAFYKKCPARLVSFLTQRDADDFSNLGSLPSVVTQPGGVDYLGELKEHPCNPPRITFVANFDYEPNIKSAVWLIEAVMPHVVEKMPEAHLILAGKGQLRSHLTNTPQWIEITGELDDLAPVYRDADVLVIPIFDGGGIKIKVLEAASTLRPIVTNSFSIIGTGLQDEKHVLVRNDEASFAEAIVDVLRNYGQYKEMCLRCRRYFEEHYSWDAVNEIWFEKAVVRTLNYAKEKNNY